MEVWKSKWQTDTHWTSFKRTVKKKTCKWKRKLAFFWQSTGQDLRSLSLQESKAGHVYEKVRSVTSPHLVRARVPVPCVWVAAHGRFIKVSPSYPGSAKKQVEHSKAVGIRRWYSPAASWNKCLPDNTYIHILRHSGIDNQTHKRMDSHSCVGTQTHTHAQTNKTPGRLPTWPARQPVWFAAESWCVDTSLHASTWVILLIMGVLIVCSLFPGAGSRYWVILAAQKAKSVHNLNSWRKKIYNIFFIYFPESLNVCDIYFKANEPCVALEMHAKKSVFWGLT